MNPNPMARQRRLGAALQRLRDQRGYSHARLAAISGVSTSVISRIESPYGDLTRRPNLRHVRQILDALDVSGPDREVIQQHASIAAAGGWWDEAPYLRMGAGQRGAAIIEYGAAGIDEYSGLLVPGLVQTAAYARHRSDGDPATEVIVAGRMERQRRIEDVEYRLILEEQAVRRWPVPRPVMREQLEHLLKLVEQPGVSIRIVPVAADLGDALAPRAPYAHVTYPDPDDPPIVAVDQVTQIQLVPGVVEVEGYARLHEQLRGAALSDADSAAVIREVIDSVT